MHWFWHGETEILRRWCRHRTRHYSWKGCFRVLIGLYSFWRQSLWNFCWKDMQNYGQSCFSRSPSHRAKWFWWCAHLRRCWVSCWLCRNLPKKCWCLRCYPSNFADYGTLWWWCSLLTCFNRFRIHGLRFKLYVCYWTWSCEDRNKRRSNQRITRWCKDAQRSLWCLA
jgi:hypothetical protein